ncbi:uncharacterized protein LOC121406304 [Lytechinus variegatus]|uniref:uncharacterized protein LOC121406304 n=1 Tax=Lytechinus variegatus TaxID=7654 RepID=UPI001BB2501F|nr:uncharacterized protein LOC121406304 [Lytechinus variegatus]
MGRYTSLGGGTKWRAVYHIQYRCTETHSRLIQAIIDAVKEEVTKQVYESIKLDLHKYSEELATIRSSVNDLSRQLKEIRRQCEDQEQYSRRQCLRFHGIAEKRDENTDQLIIDVVRRNLGINLDPGHIDRSHRITPRSRSNVSQQAAQKPRPIIIKFSRYNTRHEIYKARSKLKGTDVFIHEDLTANRQAIVNKLRFHENVKKVWTLDGRITALNADGRKISITSLADIDSKL